MKPQSYLTESQKRADEQVAQDEAMRARTEAELADQVAKKAQADISHSQLESTKRHIARETERQRAAEAESNAK